MSLRLAVALALGALAAPTFAQTQSSCDPAAGCVTFSLSSVDIGAGTITGLDGATYQITPATIFHPPSPNCAPSDPFYPWQQLVFAGANSFDPSRHAFLGLLAGWNQKPPNPNDTPHPPNPNFYFWVDSSNSNIQPVSCTGQ